MKGPKIFEHDGEDCYIEYHAFTDERDEWTYSLKEAKEIIKEWKKEGFTDWRIYKETRTLDGYVLNEDYLLGEGNFPM